METRMGDLNRHIMPEVIEFLQFLKVDQKINDSEFFLNVQVKCLKNEDKDIRWLMIKISAEGIQSVNIDFQDFFDTGRVLSFLIRELAGVDEEVLVYTDQVSKKDENNTTRTVWSWDRVKECLQFDRLSITTKCKRPCFIIKVPTGKYTVEAECGAIQRYLRKFKLVNPNVLVYLHIRIEDKILCPSFGALCQYSRFGNRYVNTDFIQYVSNEQDDNDSKHRIYPRSGVSVKLPKITIGKEIFHLKVQCIAALLTPPQGDHESTPQVTRAKLLFYGPMSLALYEDVPSNITPEDFLNFHDYGLAIGDMKDMIDDAPGKLQFDANFQVTDMKHNTIDDVLNTELLQSDNESDSSITKSEILLMFFVENVPSKTWEPPEKDTIARFQALKQHFTSILYKYSSKFGKACSSTLDRVLTNKTFEDQKKTIVSKAIHQMVIAFDNIMQITPHEEFKQQAFSVMKVSDSFKLKSKVEDNLLELAELAYSVQSPSGELGASQLTEVNNLIGDKATAQDVATQEDELAWHFLPSIDTSIGTKTDDKDSFETLGDMEMDEKDLTYKVQNPTLDKNACSFDSLGYLEFEDNNDGFADTTQKKTVIINCSIADLQGNSCNFETLGDIHFEEDIEDEEGFVSEEDFEDNDGWSDTSSQCNFDFLGEMDNDLKSKSYQSSGNLLKMPSKRCVQDSPHAVKAVIKPVSPSCAQFPTESVKLDKTVKRIKMEDMDEEEWDKDLNWDTPEI